MSFIVAFGASELLSGWGRLYLARDRVRLYPLQLASSALLFVALIQSVWGYWGFRSVSWGFGSFMLALITLLPVVGAAGIVLPPAERLHDQCDARTHYQSVYRPIFVLLAMWVALSTIAEMALVDAEFHAGQVLRIAAVLLLVGLSLTPRPAIHWIGLLLLATTQLMFAGLITPVLG